MPRQPNSVIDEDFDLDESNFANLEKLPDDGRVVLDPYNADLNIKISSENRLVAENIFQDGFAFMLASVRATHGFNRGKIGFELQIQEIFDVSNSKFEETFTPELRVGFSASDSNLRLGESPFGYAYCNNGKKACNNLFDKYGKDYGKPGDIIGAWLDFDQSEIGFTLNGEKFGPAYKLADEWTCSAYGPPLFPHVTVKNVKFRVNFGSDVEGDVISWCGLADGFKYPDETTTDMRYSIPPPPALKSDCTVICMIGLPGSGKTTWVREFLRDRGQERWCVLSSQAVLDQMKVYGVARKKLHQGRWDMIMGAVVKCLNRLILLGCRMRRNYILDMTNCYPHPRRKKLAPFQGFHRRAIVVVPTQEDYANRWHQQMRVEGKQMPSDAILEMKACFTLPRDDDVESFDEVYFAELPREDAQKVVDFYNEEGKAFKPREKKRRGDWQQEQLPAEILKKYKTLAAAVTSSPSTSTSAAAMKKVSAANGVVVTAYEKPKWLSGVSVPIESIEQTMDTAVPPPPPSPFPGRCSTSTPGPFTPRAGWPSSWPQALWRGNLPAPGTPSTTSQ